MGFPLNHPLSWDFSIINHPFWGTPILGNHHMFWESKMTMDNLSSSALDDDKCSKTRQPTWSGWRTLIENCASCKWP